MLVVVLDTSTPAVTAALVRIGTGVASGAASGGGSLVESLAERRTVNARAHGERLGPAVTEVLGEVGVRPRDLAAIVAGLGPGPFTGLRVGLVTAASIAQTLGIPAYGVCSLDGLGASTSGDTLVATDARRHEVYWAVYHDGDRVAGPAVNRPADLPAVLAGDGLGVSLAVGDGALRYAGALPWPVREEPRYPAPATLAGLAADRVLARAPGDPLTPLYLRRPDVAEPAERKRVSR